MCRYWCKSTAHGFILRIAFRDHVPLYQLHHVFRPVRVFGAIAATIGDKGLKVLVNLGKLVLTLYAAEIFFVVVVLGAVTTICRISARAIH